MRFSVRREDRRNLIVGFVGLMTVMKGLALTYSKDMQEDKEPVFETRDTLALTVPAMTGMIGDMSIKADAMAQLAGAGHATATDLADWMVRVLGLPFRDAHHATGRIVALADQRGVELADSFWARFLYMFLGYLVQTGLDDDEDEDVIVPPGSVPIMTIHQSKGLEFPFVFVGHLGTAGHAGAAQHLEHELQPFRRQLYPRNASTPAELSLQDDIRLLYVAYSRAEYGLVLMGTQQQMRKHVAVPNRDFVGFRRSTLVVP